MDAQSGWVQINPCHTNDRPSTARGRVLSAECSCHAFDHHVDGVVFGSGGDVIILKHLSDVTCNNNVIMGITKGSTSRYDE